MTSDFGSFLRESSDLIKQLDAQVRTQAEGTCRNCGKPIVFKPYFLDGKQPNPPIWFHPTGCSTCSSNPTDREPWPTAEPCVHCRPEQHCADHEDPDCTCPTCLY